MGKKIATIFYIFHKNDILIFLKYLINKCVKDIC